MTSAFNWSPGGCCCGPSLGCFHLYGLVSEPRQNLPKLSHSAGLTRYAIMLPDPMQTTAGGNLYSYNSDQHGGWSIPPSILALSGDENWQSNMTLVGRPDLGEFVWSSERVTGAETNEYLALYDAGAKQEVYRWNANLGSLLHRFDQSDYSVNSSELWAREISFNYPVPAPPPNTSVRTYQGGVREGHVYKVGSPDTIDLYRFPYSDKSTIIGGPFAGELDVTSSTGYIDVTPSFRDFPWCGGLHVTARRKYDSSVNSYRTYRTFTYFIGRLTVGVDGEMKYPTDANWHVVFQYTTALPSGGTTGGASYVARMRQFDSMNDGQHWIMQIQFPSYHDDPDNESVPIPDPDFYVRHHAVEYTNDVEVRRYLGKYDSDWQWLHGVTLGPIITTGPLGTDPNGPLGNQRAINHDGRAFFYHKDWLIPPAEAGDPGQLRYPATPFVLECWKDGALEWRIDKLSLTPVIARASKQWLLMGSQPSGTDPPTTPGSGLFPPSVEKIISDSPIFWHLLRTDGQQWVAVGQLNYDTENPQKILGSGTRLLPQGLFWTPPDVHGPYDWVCDGDRLDNTLPDDALEFEDALRATH